MKKHPKFIRFLEFLLIGVIMGLAEDLLAVYLATGERITFRIFLIVLFVAIPFAFISEYIVDHPDFWKVVLRRKKKESREDTA